MPPADTAPKADDDSRSASYVPWSIPRQILPRASIIGVLLIGVWAFALLGREFAWTGFGPSTDARGNTVPGKTLWDWLDLIGIPLTLVIVGVWFNKAERRRERRIERSRRLDSALQDYIDRMGELLLQHGLDSKEKEVLLVARASTLTVLSRLNSTREHTVVQFLHEAGLLVSLPTSPDDGVDADHTERSSSLLDGADLCSADLRHAILRGDNLSGARLLGADLQDADLRNVVLDDAILSGANLKSAQLQFAKLRRADLSGANLSEADVSGANLDRAILLGINEDGTLCDDRTVWPSDHAPPQVPGH